MRANFCLKLLLMLSLLVAGAALARKPQEFKDRPVLTEEEQAAARRNRNNISQYGVVTEVKPEPFPWMLAGLAGIAFTVAIPFAVRAYANTSREINETRTAAIRTRNEED